MHHPFESCQLSIWINSAECIPLGSQTPRCASHWGVRLRGVHHTSESRSPVCITLRSQVTRFLKKLCSVHHTVESSCAVCIIPRSQDPLCASHRRVKHVGARIEIFVSLWLPLKGQSGEILLGVNTSIIKEKITSKKSGFTKPKSLTPLCHTHAHCGVKFFELCDRISKQNRNRIQKSDGFELWKKIEGKNLVTHSL